MNTNEIILYSVLALFFVLFLVVQKRLTKIIKGLLFSLIAILAGISFYVLNLDDSKNFAFAKERVEEVAVKAKENIEKLSSEKTIKESVLLEATAINQLPELPRGCEVTALAMLLQYAGVDVDKMTLAEEVTKNTTAYEVVNGTIYYGNPNDGFVGDMYSLEGPGLGVYHKPIAELAEKYLPGAIVDFSGSDFDSVKEQLSDGRPVWVITTSKFKELSGDNFRTWVTPSGTIDVTYSEHSVLITGYDKDYVYFNDPLTGEQNKKAPIDDFIASWVQMGSQAITYSN
ncbi:C39 family peptidase [Niallia taxi]|uniref:C39 family peptidase n=1 Tax=Niallia taxi TaxID=2499688 RepID=UPI003D2DE75F